MSTAAVLASVAAALITFWGVAHVVPTSRVVATFGPLALDNKRVLLQEWIAEAVTMWGIAALIMSATIVDGGSTVTAWVYRVAAAILAALAALTATTGARTTVVWFRICVVLLSGSAALLLVASALA